MPKESICPFCFQEFALSDVHWRCMSPACKDPETGHQVEPDEFQFRFRTEAEGTPPASPLMEKHWFPSAEYRGGFLGLGKRPPNGRVAYCDWCGGQTGMRLCPHCHNELPYRIDTLDNRILAVVGAPSVGKSHYIAMLITKIRREFGPTFDISLDALDDETSRRFDADFYQPLVKGKRQLKKTQQAYTPPLIYRINVSRKNIIGGEEYPGMTLVFYDAAGENFGSRNELNLYARYVRHAAGVILLVDPLQIESVRDRFEAAGQPLPPTNVEPVRIVSRLIEQFHTYTQTRGDKKIRVPLAVSFTKVDALKEAGVLDESSLIFSAPVHRGTFNQAASQQVHDEVQALLARWDSPELETLLQQNFQTYKYFALSALGATPDGEGNLSKLDSFRVEDPLLWCLSELGFVKKG